jgi:hypothetical protein
MESCQDPGLGLFPRVTTEYILFYTSLLRYWTCYLNSFDCTPVLHWDIHSGTRCGAPKTNIRADIKQGSMDIKH